MKSSHKACGIILGIRRRRAPKTGIKDNSGGWCAYSLIDQVAAFAHGHDFLPADEAAPGAHFGPVPDIEEGFFVDVSKTLIMAARENADASVRQDLGEEPAGHAQGARIDEAMGLVIITGELGE